MLFLKQKYWNFRRRYIKKFAHPSYSLEGEDLILRHTLGHQPYGFYVDVGANHPKRFSNTYLFYRRKWSGVNIDPLPGMKRLFDKTRPRDINIEVGVGETNDELTYYMYRDSSLNTFDEQVVVNRPKIGQMASVIASQKVMIQPLSAILAGVIDPIREIDFMNVDTEGFDLTVLRSNDWDIFRPKIVLVESLRSGMDLREDDIALFLANQQYQPFARTSNNVFYMRGER